MVQSSQPGAQIEEASRTAGLDYVYQPVVAGQITEVDVRTFANHFNELPKPGTDVLSYRQPFKQSLPGGKTDGSLWMIKPFLQACCFSLFICSSMTPPGGIRSTSAQH